jgi:hypothetical protein
MAEQDSPIQIHSAAGAGSPATPTDRTYQCAHIAIANPAVTVTGSHSISQRRDRPPSPTASIAALKACTVTGSQPCINDNRPTS